MLIQWIINETNLTLLLLSQHNQPPWVIMIEYDLIWNGIAHILALMERMGYVRDKVAT